MKDYYVILQISRTATMNDIRAAYKRFALQLHPDVTGNNEEKTKMFKQLTEAYNVLSNADRRQQYDDALGVIRHVPHHDVNKTPHDVKAPHPPADFKIFDFDEWNAWHYGDNAYQRDPIIRRNRYMDVGKHETGAQYFIRKKTRETERERSQYKTRESEREMIVKRMKKRRESREAGVAFTEESASNSQSCTIS